jgi:uncharacterized membrane protein YphA (DoxX/SURF4 family)
MEIALWLVQGLLAAVFLGSGIAKSTMSKERMIATGQTGVAPFPLPVIRLTAAAEVLAAIGLVLPGLVGIGEVLTPLAAVGLMVVMVGAALSHASLREYPQVGANAVLFALALFVAVGRF